MPAALVRRQLETGERNALAFVLNPAGDFGERLGLLRQRRAFVGGVVFVVISCVSRSCRFSDGMPSSGKCS